MTIAALIVAAGRGTRAGGEQPKQWQPLAGRRVIDWTLAALSPFVSRTVLVLHPDDMALAPAGIEVTTGGATRRASVLNGLEHLAHTGTPPRYVLIHDAARATLPPAVVRDVLDALHAGAPAAAPALPVTDALWTGHEDYVTGTQDRTGLFAAQTPQGFDFASILTAHRAHEGDADDDVAIARAAHQPVTITQGHADNLKITHPGDIDRASRILGGQMDIRTGTGFDVHRFGPGDHCMLCGIAVPHERGLQGHSDADVGLHALADAIYGALAEGDIGRHFPPSDLQWKGAESHVFLRHAVRLATEKGFSISNMDITFLCERPKIGPQAQAMRAALSAITGVALDRISVKATTTERLGFTGREEGIAAQAVVTLVKPCA
ncbi:2-C-methyl-D-erythritol 2,4-cyclodiphosphate synthase [Roseovarius autotrophicus]|uniref:2-C-methyl-D-erythritol 2,4-cyclodiphosphate synthase n=1 Tax=Roseovarius autotrophicus TaxID=2824121 RepID=UPI0019EB1AB0|nr:2-C-methyl-D-erythritol 2,4-cyclodiphosphate synthase [Roseovarius autotrophicus]MBE0454221.1 2-C-methyl-D-erythritol 2,4-cyclodiphosphate synthase [Roseovarius sp.]